MSGKQPRNLDFLCVRSRPGEYAHDILQNCRDWVANGWMDEVFSMSYSCRAELSVENGQLFMRAIGDDAFYSVGLSAFGTTERDVLLAQTDGCYRVGCNGVNFFSWAASSSTRRDMRRH